MKNFISFILAAVLLGACNKDDGGETIVIDGKTYGYVSTQEMIVASEKRTVSYGVGYGLTLVVKSSENGSWEYLYDNIEGFVREAGYEYLVQVRTYKIKNPPMDGSSIKYVLERVISKTQKDSEDLPAGVPKQ